MIEDITDEEWYKKAKESDVIVRTAFFCKIGRVEAKLTMYIEPDPHGDGTGTHAHFHTPLLCPKTKIVEYPEPDRCQVTDRTCPFWEPVGGYQRDVNTRKWVYAHRFLHQASLTEFYSTQLLIASLRSKGFKLTQNLPEIRLVDLIKLLRALDVLDNATCSELDNVRDKRNKLAHGPDAYLKYQEKMLYDLASKAENLASFLRVKITGAGK